MAVASDFLEGVAEKGVPLLVDEVMPRNPKVYEEKVKWTVDQTEQRTTSRRKRTLSTLRGRCLRRSCGCQGKARGGSAGSRTQGIGHLTGQAHT